MSMDHLTAAMRRYQEAALARWQLLLEHPRATSLIEPMLLDWAQEQGVLAGPVRLWLADPSPQNTLELAHAARLADRSQREFLSVRRLVLTHSDLDRVQALREAEAEMSEARGQVLEENLGLVGMMIRRYHSDSDDTQDLKHEGVLGLIDALRRFDPIRGTRFSTYAAYWIRHALRRGQLRLDQTIRVPESAIARGKSLYASEPATPLSSTPRFDANLDDARYLGDLPGALSGLSERERWIIAHRFGIGDRPVRTLRELGRELGVSRERVRQIEMRALSRIREQLHTEPTARAASPSVTAAGQSAGTRSSPRYSAAPSRP